METKPFETVAIALGSNLGDRLAMLRVAVTSLASFMTIHKLSDIYETPPAYVTDQPAFLNAALTGFSSFEPEILLQRLKETEVSLGRQKSFHYGPRLIDIDLIFYGSRSFLSPALTLPHPRLVEREFVLRPLADIAPDWAHPETHKTIRTMLAALPDHTAQRLKETL